MDAREHSIAFDKKMLVLQSLESGTQFRGSRAQGRFQFLDRYRRRPAIGGRDAGEDAELKGAILTNTIGNLVGKDPFESTPMGEQMRKLERESTRLLKGFSPMGDRRRAAAGEAGMNS